jgi:SpoVK/Ycf46/Vps4 family AAA+-type ATPase
LQVASHTIWLELQKAPGFSPRSIKPPNDNPSATDDARKRRGSSNKAEKEEKCTYHYTYDSNGSPQIDIDIDYDYDYDPSEADFHDGEDDGFQANAPTAGRQIIPKHVQTNDDLELEARISSSIITDSPNVQWDHIAGLGAAKEALQEATILPQLFPSLYAVKGHSPFCSLLLYGPSGTGKTMLAKVVATETQRTFFSISAADILSRWHGQTEQ